MSQILAAVATAAYAARTVAAVSQEIKWWLRNYAFRPRSITHVDDPPEKTPEDPCEFVSHCRFLMLMQDREVGKAGR